MSPLNKIDPLIFSCRLVTIVEVDECGDDHSGRAFNGIFTDDLPTLSRTLLRTLISPSALCDVTASAVGVLYNHQK